MTRRLCFRRLGVSNVKEEHRNSEKETGRVRGSIRWPWFWRNYDYSSKPKRFNMGTLGRCLLLNVPTAGVPVKALLCLTVERERGNGALHAWSDHAP